MKNKNENFFYLNLSSLVTGEVGDTKKEIIKEESLFTSDEIFNNIFAEINFIRATNTIIATMFDLLRNLFIFIFYF